MLHAGEAWPVAWSRGQAEQQASRLYLTDAIAVLAASGETVLAQVAADSREVLGCNTRADLAEWTRIFRRTQARRTDWMREFRFSCPKTVLFDPVWSPEKTP